MQIDAAISRVSVITFVVAARPLPERRCVGVARGGPAPESLRSVLSHSERLSGPDPSRSAEAR
nr:MAG TPA: hypothetical protein [Caudoviricetes sp.]